MNSFNLFPNYIPSLFNYSRIQRLDRGISDNLCVRAFVVSVQTFSCVCAVCVSESYLDQPSDKVVPFTLYKPFYREFWTFSTLKLFSSVTFSLIFVVVVVAAFVFATDLGRG